ncbi:MAG: UDP-glucose 6-dehydrogenase [Rhodothalassiaceae bacterium]|nr:MAG: UDP-glucose 6-dehydrogenase [Rhodothalassiaceae bacterium]
MKVAVIGSGYVGLVTATCLADVGNHVACIDIDAERIAALKAGRCPIHEPGLPQLLADNLAAGRLAFTTDYAEGLAGAEVVLIAVGTPADEDGSADVKHVLAAARKIGRNLRGPAVVATKSTVPVGTTEKARAALMEELAARGLDLPVWVASNPEFLKEGAAVQDFMKPDRIVIGTDSVEAREVLHRLYAPFQRNHERIINMGIREAEMTKYAANAMLATKISFINEIASLCDRLGVDVEAVRLGIGADPRIGYHFIYPGLGFGGSCFPKDVRALISTAREANLTPAVLEAVAARNAEQRAAFIARIRAVFGNDLKGRRFALWGLAFKPGTDDMREAPAIDVVNALVAGGAEVRAHDPAAAGTARRIFPEAWLESGALTLVADPYDAAEGASAIVLATEWRLYRAPDWPRLKTLMRHPIVFDGRNQYDPALLEEQGFACFGIGRRNGLATRVRSEGLSALEPMAGEGMAS